MTLLYLALTLGLAYPLSVKLDRAMVGTGADNLLFMWIIAWDTHAFTHQPLSIFDSNTYYPEPRTLAYSENMIGGALFAAPIIWLTGNPVLATNALTFFAVVLCALGTYFLARQLGMGFYAAVLSGLIFGFSPPRFLRLTQLHLSLLQWIPFGLASLHAYLDGGRRRDLLLALGFFTLQVLSSGHGAVFVMVAMGGLVLYRVVLGEPLLLMKRIRDVGVAGLLLLAPVGWLALQYQRVQNETGLRRGLGSWHGSWSDLVASPSLFHTFVLSFFPDAHINENARAFLFPGYLPLVLAVVALMWMRRASDSEPATAVGRWPFNRPASLCAVLDLLVVLAGMAFFYLSLVSPIRWGLGVETALNVRPLATILALVVIAIALRVAATRLMKEKSWRQMLPLSIFGANASRWLLVIAVMWALLAGLRSMLGVTQGLHAEYFRNDRPIGTPVLTVVDENVSTKGIQDNWNDVPPSHFGVRWFGYLTVRSGGSYTFATTSDDGSELWIDGQQVVNNGGLHGSATQTGRIQLAPGSHAILIEYFESGEPFEMEWAWARDGERLAAVPSWLLSLRRVPYALLLTAHLIDLAAAGVAVVWLAIALLLLVQRGRAPSPRTADLLTRFRNGYRRDPVVFYALLTLLTINLTVAAPFSVWPLVYSWPGLSFIRVPSRFLQLGILGIALLAGFGFERLSGRLASRRRSQLALALGVLLVAEFICSRMPATPYRFEVPAVDRWLDKRPKPFVIAEVPLGNKASMIDFEDRQALYIVHAMAHWQKTVAGYSGWRTPLHYELYDKLDTFPDDPSITRLEDLGVNYVVVHTDLYPPGVWPEVAERLKTFEARLTLEHVDGAGRVYSLRPSSLPQGE